MSSHPKTVWHLMRKQDGTNWHCVSDLVFIEGVPHVVLVWSELAGKEIPLVTVELDPALLQIGPVAGAESLYQGEVVDPRTGH